MSAAFFIFLLIHYVEVTHKEQKDELLDSRLLLHIEDLRFNRLFWTALFALNAAMSSIDIKYGLLMIYNLCISASLYFTIDFQPPGKSLWQMAKAKFKSLASKVNQPSPAPAPV